MSNKEGNFTSQQIGGQSTTSGGLKSTSHWYTSEIQQMMYGFGDCRKPLLESAVLIEEIVKQQMTSLIIQTADIAGLRNSRFIGLEDVLFLMRRDKNKLKRLLRYLQIKDQKAQVMKSTGGEDGEEGTELYDKKKGRSISMDFLSSIDTTGELLALFDDESVDNIKQERLLRAELQSRNMDATQYIEFAESRRVSLGKKYKSPRFREWLLNGVNVDIKPSQPSIEIFSYLAYETIAQIVDFALIVKQDMKAIKCDPLSRAFPAVTVNIQQAPITCSTNVSSVQIPCLTSPSGSPPSTPTSTSMPSTLGPLASAVASKNKPKKRKKSVHGSSLDMVTVQAIQPSEIQEAIRRYQHCIGPFSSSVRTHPIWPGKVNLFCC